MQSCNGEKRPEGKQWKDEDPCLKTRMLGHSVVTLGNTLVKSVVVGFVVNSVRCIECTKWIHKQCSE